ncbi:MAG: TRAP transporter small permease [Verrucomicrobiales bacterium]|jgi:TRAP-type C4-dicarboxylate transport system permease small subunit|nr:TRAP transporter small permease [Verrucomicrobiales bacterium]
MSSISNKPLPISQTLKALVRVLEWLTIVLFAALVLDVLWGVVSRYVLGTQSRWTEELAIYLLVWVSLLGATLAFRDRAHLGVDYFVGKLDPSARRLATIIAEVAVILFASFGLVYGGYMLVSETLRSGQLTPAMGWKIGYFYSVVPLSGLFIVAFSLENLLSGCITSSIADHVEEEVTS